MQKTLTRNHSLDIMRILAVMAVAMIHVNMTFVSSYEITPPEFRWGNIFDSASRFCVPMFVMISGALLLDEDRQISYQELYQKRIPKMLLLLFFWSLVYALLYPARKDGAVNPSAVLDAFLLGHYHLWYLYMQIGLYAILPMLRSFVTVKNRHWVKIFLAMALVSQFLPTTLHCVLPVIPKAKVLTQLIGKFQISTSAYVAYFITGWLITQRQPLKRKWKYCALAVSVLSLLATIFYVQKTKDYSYGYSDKNIVIYLFSTGLFTFFYSARLHLKGFLASIIEKLSQMSFGIYAVHVIVMNYVRQQLPYRSGSVILPAYILYKYALTLIGACLLTWIISKIPLLKKGIRM